MNPSNNFNSNTALQMYNQSHVNGSIASWGSYYNARVANARTATETISVEKTYTENICSKNWTMPSYNQLYTSVRTYSSSWPVQVYPENLIDGWSAGNTSGSCAYWWSGTALASVNFYWMRKCSSGAVTDGNYNGVVRYGLNVRCVAK